MCSARRAATWSAVLLSSLISIPIRVDRSTRVATALAAVGADDQVAFPVAGHRPVVGLGGPFGDVDHPDDLRARLRRCGPAGVAGHARYAGTRPAPCAAHPWPARRSLDRSPRATPTTVARRDDPRRSRRAICSGDHFWRAVTACTSSHSHGRVSIHDRSGGAPPRRHPPERGKPDTRPGHHARAISRHTVERCRPTRRAITAFARRWRHRA